VKTILSNYIISIINTPIEKAHWLNLKRIRRNESYFLMWTVYSRCCLLLPKSGVLAVVNAPQASSRQLKTLSPSIHTIISSLCLIDLLLQSLTTSPAVAVAKYCDEHVSLSVCLSDLIISGTTRAIFRPTKFLRMLPMAVDRSSSGRVTKSQAEGVILGVFLPTDNAL